MPARMRVAVALVALVFAALSDRLAAAAPLTLIVVVLDQVGDALARPRPARQRRGIALTVLCLGACAAGVSIAVAGKGVGVLLLLPAITAGLGFGQRGAALAALSGGVSALAASAGTGQLTSSRASEILLWSLEAIVSGFLAAWWQRNQRDQEADSSVAAEAGLLLRRLHEIAESLDTGFDAPAAAEMALQDLSAQMRTARSAILVGYDPDPAVPLAIRGADRTPWPDPTDAGSVLWPAWHHGQGILTSWDGDVVKRSVLAVPIYDQRGTRMGVLVADRPFNTPFSQEDLRVADEVARRHAPQIDLSLVFASLREQAAVEERERLAREMHDGIAQEMVALGFGIDALRSQARNQGSPLADDLDHLRAELSRLLTDLRLHIADLRIAVRPDTGLGAMIGSRLQGFGASAGITTRMQLSETGFRLPAHTEVLIYRLFLQVLADARRALDTRELDVRLNVAAPRVELWVSHDGSSALGQDDFENHPLTELGGEITVQPFGPHGVLLRMRMRARDNRVSATLSHERIPQPS